MNNPPFFYKVSFHLLVQDKDKELSHQNWQKEFHNADPFTARQEAFDAFSDYLENLETNDKIQKEEYGNFKIVSPSNIPKIPNFEENISLEEMALSYTEYREFSEDLDVLLVITDDKLVDEIGYGDSTLAIHSVSSQPVNMQSLIDNLTAEMRLYRRCDIDTSSLAREVQHYGEDFEESEEEEGAENYTILPTPMQWSTREIYDRKLNEEIEGKHTNSKSLWENIIEGGESNTLEFKPSLIYNFLPDTPNHIPRFNNAKTICGFLNARGGVLLIGISDEGNPQGIDADLKFLGSKDKIKLNIDQLIHSYVGDAVIPLIDSSFEKLENKEFIAIKVQPSSRPVFLKNHNPNTGKTTKHFFARRSASTTEIKDTEEIIDYIFNHWSPNIK
ncbi:AlbA family DNA-binding domain-containing protein [Salegentibacter maritimus]|uniref:AlbA family DNA-binding domain-containing protein n=1 Tax=Salegentibacter maritimus TaxID=2794347 RepID=UPI0018E40038|nr:ATP-binding protein [Salegentibacter maritimus]MBI6115967.1 ATP-binding protein [Salegentibacter maritimus]